MSPLREWCERLELPYRPEWEAPVAAHLELLSRWSPRMNLTSVADPPQALVQHVMDSLSLLSLAPVAAVTAGRAIDVGSGAGFPGVSLSIAMPSLDWMLLEPRRKRCVFLRRVLAAAGLGSVTVREDRLPLPGLNEQFNLVVSRATFPPPKLLDMLAPLLAPNGTVGVMLSSRPAGWPGDERWVLLADRELEFPGRMAWVGALQRRG